MRKIGVFITVFIVYTFLELPILIGQPLIKSGIYKSFQEFKSGSPSQELVYQFIEVQWEYETGIDITLYKIKATNDVLKSMGKLFGFSDGKDFYFNDAESKLAVDNEFYKTERIGKYLYFDDIEQVPVMKGEEIAIISYFYSKVLDTKTGEVITLNPQNLKAIISSNAQLVKSFSAEPNPDSKLKEYLVKYYTKPTSNK